MASSTTKPQAVGSVAADESTSEQGNNYPVFENTLSSVLNDPALITRSTSFVMPPIEPSPYLPSVSIDSFMPYLSKVKEPLKTLMGLRAERSAALLKIWNSKHAANAEPAANEKLKLIPEMYFQENFQMFSGQTFNAIFQVDNMALQADKLSQYLDIIELEITERISRRSTGFFNALNNLQRLHSQVFDICRQTDDLRTSIKVVDDALVRDSLMVVQMRNKRKRLDMVLDKLLLIRAVKEAPPNIDLLIANNDYFGALEIIRVSTKTLSEHLVGIVALNPIINYLKEATSKVEEKMSNKILEIAMGGEYELPEELVEDIVPLGIELFQQGQLLKTLQVYRDRLQTEIKELAISLVVPNAKSEQDIDSVKSLEIDDFISRLNEFYRKVVGMLTRIKSVGTVLTTALKERENQRKLEYEELEAKLQAALDAKMSGHPQALSEEEISKLKDKRYSMEKEWIEQNRQRKLVDQECSDVLFSTSEVAHVQAARLLKVRADLHRRLPLEKFAILHESSNKFLSESETICGRQCYGLRPTVSAQARSYLETFHTNRMNTIRAILEAENWQKAEVACEFPPIFACLLDPEVDLKSVERTSGSTSTANLNELELDGQKYLVVNSLLLFARFLHEYLVCVDTLPVLARDIVSRVAEILQLFNRRTNELVLLNGAVQTAQLKNVTASHYALASQCLSLVIRIIPPVVERLRKYLPAEQHKLLEEIERVLQDYDDHRQRIVAKFVAIMSNKVDECLRNYKLDDANPNASAPFVVLYKKTTTLLRILKPILPMNQIKKIFSKIFTMYNEKLVHSLSKLNAYSDTHKQRLRTDVKFLWQKLNELDVGDVGEDLIAFVAKIK